MGLRNMGVNRLNRIPIVLLHKLRSHGICGRKRTHRGIRPKTKSSSTASVEGNIAMSTSLGLINCRSVCNKADVVADYIGENDFDIVGLTETWLSNDDKHKDVIASLTPDGYDMVHVPRPNQTTGPGGGVAILFKCTYKRGRFTCYKAETFESTIC